jgi:hypothetical protein
MTWVEAWVMFQLSFHQQLQAGLQNAAAQLQLPGRVLKSGGWLPFGNVLCSCGLHLLNCH